MVPAEIPVQNEGQALLEYGLVLVLVSIAAVAILTTLGLTINESYYELVVNAFP